VTHHQIHSLFLLLQLVGDCAYVRDQLTQYTTPSLPNFEAWPADGHMQHMLQ
jgi:hypothetical protein